MAFPGHGVSTDMAGQKDMAGNSQRRGARRKEGTKKGATVGSGGRSRRSLEGKGPTPPAEARNGHPAARRAAAAARASTNRGGSPQRPAGSRPLAKGAALPETVVGRNPVVEASSGGRAGDRPLRRARARLRRAGNGGRRRPRPTAASPCSRCPGRSWTGSPRNAIHQGLALVVPPYQYAHPDDLLGRAAGLGSGRADRRGGRRHRPAQPGRDRPVRGGVRRARRRGPGAAQRGHDGVSLAHVGGHRGAAARRPVHEPGPDAEGLRGQGPDDRRAGRRRHHRHRRLRAGDVAARDRGRLGGPRAGPADADGLRRHRVAFRWPAPWSR